MNTFKWNTGVKKKKNSQQIQQWHSNMYSVINAHIILNTEPNKEGEQSKKKRLSNPIQRDVKIPRKNLKWKQKHNSNLIKIYEYDNFIIGCLDYADMKSAIILIQRPLPFPSLH